MMDSQLDERLESFARRSRRWSGRVSTAVFGDLYGVVLFLTALAVYVLVWRVEFFINDNWVIANTLLAVADGHLYIDGIAYGNPSGAQPGMHVIDGRLYGRNYGQVVLALPAYWLLEALLVVVDFRVLLIGLHGVVLLALGVYGGRLVGREVQGAACGAVGGVGLLLVNTALATNLDPEWTALAALQLTTMVAAGLLGVVLYRTFRYLDQRHTGIAIGLIAALASPVGFWATIPKRHVFTALAGAVLLYAFLRSRGEDVPPRDARRYRMLAYTAIALTAWINAAEALLFLIVFAPLDLLTARARSHRDVAWVTGSFLVALAPFLLTNLLVAGNPVEPANLWPGYSGVESVMLGDPSGVPGEGPTTPGGTATPGTPPDTPTTPGETQPPASGPGPGDVTPTGDGGLPTVEVGAILASLGVAFDRFLGPITRGLDVALGDPARLGHIFVRSGGLGLRRAAYQGVDMTLLESTPILGALIVFPVVALRRTVGFVSGGSSFSPVELTPARQTDLLAVATAVVFSLFYIPRLPLHAQITVRYLLPVVPLLLYAVGRLAPFRRTIDRGFTAFLWSYVAVVLLGTQVLLAWVILNDLRLGEAVQLHAVVNVIAAASLGWLAVELPRRWLPGEASIGSRAVSVGAILVGIVAGLTTAFVLLAAWSYFVVDMNFALPLVERLSEAITIQT